jgi:integrase
VKKTWQKTRIQNLLRHKSGRYYARAFAGGKEVWKSLGTSHFSVAEAKLAEFLQEHRARRKGDKLADARMTFGQALEIHTQALKDNHNIKPSTRHYWQQVFASLLRSWPGLAEREIRRISSAECLEWSVQFVKSASPTRFNNTVAALRHVFQVALGAGILYRDPAMRLKRARIRPKQLSLPSRNQFQRLIETIATAGGRFSRRCSEFVQGLAFTGMRKNEAATVQWRDLLFEHDEIVVRGDEETGTKNWEVRRVPMVPEAREFFAFGNRRKRSIERAAS